MTTNFQKCATNSSFMVVWKVVGSYSVGQTEWHHDKFIVVAMHSEGRFGDILLYHPNLVIPYLQIQLHEFFLHHEARQSIYSWSESENYHIRWWSWVRDSQHKIYWCRPSCGLRERERRKGLWRLVEWTPNYVRSRTSENVDTGTSVYLLLSTPAPEWYSDPSNALQAALSALEKF